MAQRVFVTGQYHHVFNKSIYGYQIFNHEEEFFRMRTAMAYYRQRDRKLPYARFIRSEHVVRQGIVPMLYRMSLEKEMRVRIVAYCIMPTHVHLLVQQLEDGGISSFMSDTLNSYTKYFNLRHKRAGPLWVGQFKDVVVNTDEQLLHLTRYIHLNPVVAGLVRTPEEWEFSSYREYLRTLPEKECFCDFQRTLEVSPERYKDFVNKQIDYQKKLAVIRRLILE